MEFTAPLFVAVFLPLVLLMRILLRDRFRNVLLLLASLAFYSWGNPSGITLLLGLSAFNFVLAQWLSASNGILRRLVCVCGVTVDVAALAMHKYLPELIGVAGMPLGLSFYVFQAISYLVDLYRGTIVLERRPIHFLLYLSFFPRMIAGPICRYAGFAVDIANTCFSFSEFAAGLERFAIGFAKKVLVADVLARSADVVFGAPAETVPCVYCWTGAIAYLLQIYFDFSGCSDMAIGIGRALGFRFPENFDYPYASCSVQEFWRRWHISLSTWFRDYLYIPLGGNRKGSLRTYLNQMIVFLLCGAWHGATWTYVVWGGYHGLGLTMEKAGLRRFLDRLPRPLANLYVLVFVLIGWVLFRAESFSQAAVLLKQMLLGNAAHPYWTFVPYYHVFDITGCVTFLIGFALAYPFVGNCFRFLRDGIRLAVVWALFAVALSFAMTGAFSPSIYGQF